MTVVKFSETTLNAKAFNELTAAGTVRDFHTIPFSFRLMPETFTVSKVE
jgi:hypothetical protein